MDDFWQTFLDCESRGFEFLKGNVWQIDSYDVVVTLSPGDHSIGVTGSAQGTILAERCDELRFLLGLNVAQRNHTLVDVRTLRCSGQELPAVPDEHMFSIELDHTAPCGDTVVLEFDYRSVPIARKCWVNSTAGGPVPGLGDGETELCFEGYWLPFANVLYQPVTAEVKIVDRSGRQVIFNGKLLEISDDGSATTYRYRTCTPTMPTVIAGDFGLVTKPISDDSSVRFYHQPGYEEIAGAVVGLAADVFGRFVHWLGVNPLQGQDFGLVQLKRSSFGQYAPFPLVIFPEQDIAFLMGDDAWQKLTGMLGHEIGHFWFGGHVRSQPDEQWLSEGFAQYMNLLTIEAVYGRSVLNSELCRYIEAVAAVETQNQPPLASIPLSYPGQPLLVRLKGALVLHSLRQVISLEGFRSFLGTLVDRYGGENIGTDAVEAVCRDCFPEMDVVAFFDLHLRRIAEYEWDTAVEVVVAR